MKLRVTIEIEYNEKKLDSEFSSDENHSYVEKIRNAFKGLGEYPEEEKRLFIVNSLDQHHGFEASSIRSFSVVESTLE